MSIKQCSQGKLNLHFSSASFSFCIQEEFFSEESIWEAFCQWKNLNTEHTRILTNKSLGDSPNFYNTYIYVIARSAIIGEALLPMKENIKT